MYRARWLWQAGLKGCLIVCINPVPGEVCSRGNGGSMRLEGRKHGDVPLSSVYGSGNSAWKCSGEPIHAPCGN